jgi:hypothetical protein
MNYLGRLIRWLASVCALLGTVMLAHHRLSPVPAVREAAEGQEQIQQPDEELEAAHHALRRRRQLKDGVVASLLRGRLTLFEAAARFRAIDQTVPMPRPVPLGWLEKETSYAERLCVCVIRYARGTLEEDPLHATMVAALEADLLKHKTEHKTFVLPVVPVDWVAPLWHSRHR